MGQRSVVVVGGGIAGLVAARRLAQAGADVTLLEAGPRLGGQVRAATVAGHTVDLGAESLHLAGPHVGGFLDELGLGGEVITAKPGHTWIWTDRRLRPLPAGVGPAGPSRLGPVVGSRILSPRGLARAAAEPLVPRSAGDGDVAVGAAISRRFGRQVTDRIVDPLLGNLHAGDVTRLSVRAVTPHLAAQLAEHRSLLLARRRDGRTAGMSFVSFRGGLTTLTERLLRGTEVTVRRCTAVREVKAVAGGYRVEGPGGELATFDAVVLAVPAHIAAGIVQPLAGRAAAQLGSMRSASVATVVAAYPRRAAARALRGTGVLVPSSAGRLLKAATFLSGKWPHLDDPDRVLVRMSAGRAGSRTADLADDAELVERLHDDLAAATGLAAAPVDVHVQRWPRGLTQLEVGHLERMTAVRDELRRYPRLVLAGASYDGLGLASCIGSGERAARTLRSEWGVPTGAEAR